MGRMLRSASALLAPAVLFVVVATSSTPPQSPSEGPIATMGHGAAFGPDGERLPLTPDFLAKALAHYRDGLLSVARDDQRARFEERRALLFDGADWDLPSSLYAEAVLLEWLARELRPLDSGATRGRAVLMRSAIREPDGAPFRPPEGLLARIRGTAADPIPFVEHDGLFDADGNEIEATPEFVEFAQNLYLGVLGAQASEIERARLEHKRDNVFRDADWDPVDRLLAVGALVDWFIDEVNPLDADAMRRKNDLLREALVPDPGSHALPPELEERLSAEELDTTYVTLQVARARYVERCRAAGVPIPPDWGTSAWGTSRGRLTVDFLFQNDPGARVFVYKSTEPEGVCFALPRGEEVISALGIICLGKASSNACFWDNQDETGQAFYIDLDEQVPLAWFAAGPELEGGAGGVCVDCHAGENPFIIHPGTSLGRPVLDDVPLMPDDWHKPLVHPSWPKYEPSTLLDGVESASKCTTCHSRGEEGGRLPSVSGSRNPDWCEKILLEALLQTMPEDAVGDPSYRAHVAALAKACGNFPKIGFDRTVIDFGDVELGESRTESFTISNSGDAEMGVSVRDETLDRIPLLGPAPHWDLELGDHTINRRTSRRAPQVFRPTALGRQNAYVLVVSDDPLNPRQSVLLTGRGVQLRPENVLSALEMAALGIGVLAGLRAFYGLRRRRRSVP